MAKCAEKRTENPYRMSRIRAGFRNRQEPAERLFIDDSALDRYETGQTVPPADRVLDMARLYRDMSLAYRHCTDKCPLGAIHTPLEDLDLPTAAIAVMSAHRRLGKALEEFIDILSDGVIAVDEIPRLNPIIETMKEMRKNITTAEYTVATQIANSC